MRRERASSLCVLNGRLLMVCLRDPVTGQRYLFPPGGKIESGETPEETAIRETYEETGYHIELNPASVASVVRYPFRWGNEEFDCLTHLFCMNLVNPADTPCQVHDRDYNLGTSWVPLSMVGETLNFSPQLRDAVLAML